MFWRINSTLSFLISFLMSLYLIVRAGYCLFDGHILNYNEFKKNIIIKKISKVYILDKEAWFFETRGIGRRKSAIEWKAVINNQEAKNDLLNFLKEHNIQAITNPGFINIYFEKIKCCMLFILAGIILIGLIKSILML